jgi:hypothetical protein
MLAARASVLPLDMPLKALKLARCNVDMIETPPCAGDIKRMRALYNAVIWDARGF